MLKKGYFLKVIFIILLTETTAENTMTPFLNLEKQELIAEEMRINNEVAKIAGIIKHKESRGNYHLSGGSGEYGAYQFMPSTWYVYSMEVYGKITPMTEANQDEVAVYAIKKLLEKHNPAEIAAIWNSGKPTWEGRKGVNKYGIKYDVEAYVLDFLTLYN
jgi:hypothetical protein